MASRSYCCSPRYRAGPELGGPEGKKGLRLRNIVLERVGCPEISGLPCMFPATHTHSGTLSECRQCEDVRSNENRARGVLAIAITAGLGFLAACNPPASDQHLQEQAAQATETAKQQSKEALAQARVAAANAERAVNDVAAGVKQGLDSKNPPAGSSPIDLNSASVVIWPPSLESPWSKQSRSFTIGPTPPPMTW